MSSSFLLAGARLRRGFFVLSLALLACSAPAAENAQAPAAAQAVVDPGVPDALQRALLGGKWDEALGELRKLEKDQPKLADWWSYLRGRTLVLSGKAGEALAVFETVEALDPPSAFAAKAKFARADALRALGRVAEAEGIYESEAKRLLSQQRQEELAAIYFELADGLSNAPKVASPEAPKLDFERAYALYRKVLELDVGPASRERALWRSVVCRHAAQRWDGALEAAAAYRKLFDPGLKSAEHSGAHVFDVRALEADAFAQSQNLAAARRAYEDLSAAIVEARANDGAWKAWRASAKEADLAALATLDGRARYARASTFINSPPENELAVGALQRFLAEFPEHELAANALSDLADRHQRLNQTEEALRDLDQLFNRPAPATQDLERLRQFEVLRMGALFRRGNLLANAQRFDEATAAFNEYVARFPTGPNWTQAQQALVNIDYNVGAAARAKGEFERARMLWNKFLSSYPLDARAADTQFALGSLFEEQARALAAQARKEGRQPVRADMDALYRSAVEQWRSVVSKYEGSSAASNSYLNIGRLLERELGELEGAVEAYRACTFGPALGDAQAALAEMTTPSLAIETRRVWRSGESPAIHVATRNLESLKLEIYALDLEAYFRKNLTHGGVGGLDLDLIAADKTAERTVDGFARYLAVERDLELPVKGPGVWAVAVTGGELRATTLVIASDLDVLVRSSADEALVFVEDMPAQRAAANVRVLIAGRGADGAPAVLESNTDAGGVAKCKLDALECESGVNVLVLRDGHVATNALATLGKTSVAAPTARGLCYTDRPVYRPGETVRWRVIAREVVDGALAATPGKPVEVRLVDSEGRVAWTGRAELSRFGAASGEIALDEEAALGGYSLQCRTESGATHAAQLEVARYRAPKVKLELEAPRVVWFRGETIEALARASWTWGEPVAGSPLVVDLPDGRQLELTTDEKGEARFEFATREFASEQTLLFRAALTEEQAQAQTAVYLALREFSLTLDAPDSAVLAGSSFAVDVGAMTPDREPKGVAATLEVLAQRERGATETVLTREVAIDEKTGEAHTSLTLDEGSYTLVVRATDRFGNPISAQREVHVSGASDERKLRFFVDSHQLEVGGKASLALVNRAKPGLALVTFEAGKLLEHRIVRLESGSNTVAFEVGHTHFPNVIVAAAMMGEQQLFSDEAQFQVTRQLVIDIEPERTDLQPGDEVVLRLRARDQLGLPVEAELSLAVLDEALLGIYPDRTPAIRGVFESGRMRPASFGVSSSCDFRYEGVTITIASALLAEAERLKEQERWSKDRAQTVEKLGALGYLGGPASPGPARTLSTGSDDFFLGRGERGSEFDSAEFNDAIGIGGGAGGAFGGRFGGKKNLRARGGAGVEASLSKELLEREVLAYWSPSIVTDAKGEAIVRFQAPKSSKRWACVSRGADADALVGEARASFVARDEFFVELRAPIQLVEGDRPRFLARLHNLTGMGGVATLNLRVENGGKTETYPQQALLGGRFEDEVFEWVFPAPERGAAVGEMRVTLDLTAELVGAARAGTRAATVSARPYKPVATEVAKIDVRPYGVEVSDAKSGLLRDEASFTLELAGASEPHARVVELALGPDVDSLLVATALGEGLPKFRGASDLVAATAQELMGVCATLDLVASGARNSSPDYARLRDRAQSLVGRIEASQMGSGTWSWLPNVNEQHNETTSLCVLALSLAKEHGLEVVPAVLTKGRTALQRVFNDASMQADELKALVSWALAASGGGDFGALNRLHRQRASLSPAALAYSALALSAMDRAVMAEELAAELETRSDAFETVDRRPTCGFRVEGNDPWMQSPLEMTALAAYALEAAKPRSEKLAPAIEQLLARRPWFDARSRGLALAAIARFQGESKPMAAEARVTVRVGGAAPQTVVLGASRFGERLSFAIADDAPAKVAVQIKLEGRGAPHFSALLRGFTKNAELASNSVRITPAAYLAAAPRYHGAQIDVGFDVVVDDSKAWRNEVRDVAFGELARCELRISRYSPKGVVAPKSPRYFIAEIPLPAGVRVLEGSARASGALIEERPGMLIVHFAPSASWCPIEYTLVADAPGSYRTLPVVVRSVGAEGRVETATASPELRVLARDEPSANDPYRPTPDELFALGRAKTEAGEREEGRLLLQKLVDDHEAALQDTVLSQAARLLLFANIDRKASRDIVRYFEILKEKDPQFYVPFEQVLAIGAAYREIDEHERALTIFRATLEETFGKELRIVGALEAEKESSEALDMLARLCGEYPDAPVVVTAKLTLSDKLLQLTPNAAKNESLKRAGRDRAKLLYESILELQRFLAVHPKDPQAPQAGLNLITAQLALNDYGRAAKLGEDLAAAFTEPRFADAFLYSRAVAKWYLGEDDVALELLGRIAKAEYTDAAGKKFASPNRDLALYILAQIHHARQEFGDAAEYYERVARVFADARETLEALREKQIALPELTRVRPGDKVKVDLSYRNVGEAEVLVYPVDLMTLYLREKNLSRITQVNLSGIAPRIRRTLELKDASGVRPGVQTFELALPEAGAYLVICRGDELHASGLVLVSDLAIDVDEASDSGRVRVQVVDRDSGRFVRDVDVRVIGSSNDDFVIGRTDPRGLFSADGIAGSATIIARNGERDYAFHRGAVEHSASSKPKRPSPAQGAGYFDNVLDLNEVEQKTRGQNWQMEVDRERKGVQVLQVK